MAPSPWTSSPSLGEMKSLAPSGGSCPIWRPGRPPSSCRASPVSARRSCGRRRAGKPRGGCCPGAGVEAEARLAFAGLSELLAGVLDDVAPGLAPPRRRALEVALLLAEPDGPPPDAHAIGLALLDVLRALSDAGPVLLALDDVQWLDASSAAVLQVAMRRLRAEPVGRADRRCGTIRSRACPSSSSARSPSERLTRLSLAPARSGRGSAPAQGAPWSSSRAGRSSPGSSKPPGAIRSSRSSCAARRPEPGTASRVPEQPAPRCSASGSRACRPRPATSSSSPRRRGRPPVEVVVAVHGAPDARRRRARAGGARGRRRARRRPGALHPSAARVRLLPAGIDREAPRGAPGARRRRGGRRGAGAAPGAGGRWRRTPCVAGGAGRCGRSCGRARGDRGRRRALGARRRADAGRRQHRAQRAPASRCEPAPPRGQPRARADPARGVCSPSCRPGSRAPTRCSSWPPPARTTCRGCWRSATRRCPKPPATTSASPASWPTGAGPTCSRARSRPRSRMLERRWKRPSRSATRPSSRWRSLRSRPSRPVPPTSHPVCWSAAWSWRSDSRIPLEYNQSPRVAFARRLVGSAELDRACAILEERESEAADLGQRGVARRAAAQPGKGRLACRSLGDARSSARPWRSSSSIRSRRRTESP